MTPVDMICRHDPDNGSIGDCFRACIASLLDLPATEVPHFCELDWGKSDNFTWFKALNEWLALRGFSYMDLTISQELHGHWFDYVTSEGFDVYHVLSGISPRGFDHSVVARNGVPVHDPHPDRTFLKGPKEEGWLYGLLIARGTTAP